MPAAARSAGCPPSSAFALYSVLLITTGRGLTGTNGTGGGSRLSLGKVWERFGKGWERLGRVLRQTVPTVGLSPISGKFVDPVFGVTSTWKLILSEQSSYCSPIGLS
jgi:hypothetical protein